MSHDDLVDSTVMALMRFRQGGFIRLPTDEPEEQRYFKRRGSGYINRDLLWLLRKVCTLPPKALKQKL